MKRLLLLSLACLLFPSVVWAAALPPINLSVTPYQGLTEDEAISLAKQFVSPKLTGPERVFCIMKKMLPAWKSGAKPLKLQHTMSLNGLTKLSVNLQPVVYIPMLFIRSNTLIELSEEFFELLPESSWKMLSVSRCPQLSRATQERLVKAWMAAGRDLNDLHLPVPIPTVQVKQVKTTISTDQKS